MNPDLSGIGPIVGKNELLDAKRRHQEARETLRRAVAAAYPVGSTVAVSLGRARVIGVVERTGGSFGDPTLVYIRNVRTGKTRKFSATYEGHKAEICHSV